MSGVPTDDVSLYGMLESLKDGPTLENEDDLSDDIEEIGGEEYEDEEEEEEERRKKQAKLQKNEGSESEYDDDEGEEEEEEDADVKERYNPALTRKLFRKDLLRYYALKSSSVVVALKEFKQIQKDIPFMTREQIALRAPELAKHLSSFVVGWSKEGILLRNSMCLKDANNESTGFARTELEDRANELLVLEQKLLKSVDASLLSLDRFKDMDLTVSEEKELKETKKEISGLVEIVLFEEPPPPKQDRSAFAEPPRRTTGEEDDEEKEREKEKEAEKNKQKEKKEKEEKEDQDLTNFFSDKAQSQHRKEFGNQRELKKKKEAFMHPLFKEETYRPYPLSLVCSTEDKEEEKEGTAEFADGTYSELHDFITNKKLQVQGVEYGEEEKEKEKEEASSSPSDDSIMEANSSEKCCKLSKMVDELQDYDIIDWEERIMWDDDSGNTSSEDSSAQSCAPGTSKSRRSDGVPKDADADDNRLFTPPDDYVNPHMESGEWLKSISWGDENDHSTAPRVPVVYDMNDPNILFQNASEGGDTVPSVIQTVHMATKSPLSRKLEEDHPLEKGIDDPYFDRMFNVSYDKSYATNRRKLVMKQRSGTSTVRHGIPAVNLSVFPTAMTEDDYIHFHRPVLSHKMKKKTPVPVTLGMDPRNLKVLKDCPGKLKNISAMSGSIMLLEHLEQYPALVSYVAMGSLLKTYYRKENEDDMVLPSSVNVEGELVFLDPADASPFEPLGLVRPGTSVVTVENRMTRMPVARHVTPETDFLLVFKKDRWCIRELGPVFLAGQEFPQDMDSKTIPSPGVSNQKRMLAHWFKAFTIRTLQKYKNSSRQFRTQDFAEAFGQINEQSIRDVLRNYCCNCVGSLSSYEIMPDVRFPPEEEIRSYISPEEVCAYISMMHGVYLLSKEGITRTFDVTNIQTLQARAKNGTELTNDDKEGLEQMRRILCSMPWTISEAFHLLKTRKNAVNLFDPCQPLVRCPGFSFVPQSSRRRKQTRTPRQPVQTDMRRITIENALSTLKEKGVTPQDLPEQHRRKVLLAKMKQYDPTLQRSTATDENKDEQLKQCHSIFEKMLIEIAKTEPPPVVDEAREQNSFLSKLSTLAGPASKVESPTPVAKPSPAPNQARPVCFSSGLANKTKNLIFRGRSRNPLIRNIKQSVSQHITSSGYKGTRWKPDEGILPVVSVAKTPNIPTIIRRGRPRKHPLPDPNPTVKTEQSETNETSTATTAITTAAAAATTATASDTVTPSSEKRKHHHHHHRRHRNSESTGEPEFKRPRKESGVVMDGMVYPPDTSKPSTLSILHKIFSDPSSTAWSDELANEITGLSPLDMEFLVEVCKRRYNAKLFDMELTESLYDLCWSVANGDMEQAKERASRLELDESSSILGANARMRHSNLRSILICGRCRFCINIASASYDTAASSKKQPEQLPAAEIEASAVMNEIAKKKRPPRELLELVRDTESNESISKRPLRTTVTPLRSQSSTGLKRTMTDRENEDIVMPEQPPAKVTRSSSSRSKAATCVDELEDTLRKSYALPPRDDERVTSFIIRLPEAPKVKKADDAPSVDTNAPSLEPCRVHLTFVPQTLPNVPPVPAPAPSSLPVPALKLNISLPLFKSQSEPAPGATSVKLVLSKTMSTLPAAPATAADGSALRRSTRAPHPTERFADLVPPGPAPSSANRKKTPSAKKNSPSSSSSRKMLKHHDGAESDSSSSSPSSSESDGGSNRHRHRHHHHHHHHHHH